MTKKNEHPDKDPEGTISEAQAEHTAGQQTQPALDEKEGEEKRLHSTSYEIVEALQNELSEARSKADEYLDGWQRSRAEFTNYKKRVEREQSQAYQVAAGNVIRRFLGVVDDMERALKNRPQEGEGAAWANGIELIYRKLANLLENEGVTPMKALGEQFDPNFHEAVISEDNEAYESGQIIEVLQQGYMLGDKVLRPAMVRVAR